MKRTCVCLLFLCCLFVFGSCKRQKFEDSYYKPIIVDNDTILSDSLRDIFSSYSFPKSVIPILIAEKEIPDSLYTAVRADKIFKSIYKTAGNEKVKRYGLLIYVTQKPRLIQLRLGKLYDPYAYIEGTTLGNMYFETQRLFSIDSCDQALNVLLDNTCSSMVRCQNLNLWKRLRLNGGFNTIQKILGWSAYPSNSFYSKHLLKPTYRTFCFLSNIFQNPVVVLFIIYFFLLLLQYIFSWFNARLLNRQITVTQGIIAVCLKYLPKALFAIVSYTTISCTVLLSAGRMEDLIALHAFGIYNLDFFIDNPDFLSKNSSYLLFSLFVVFLIVEKALSNELFQMSCLSPGIQYEIWGNLSESDKLLLLTTNKVDKLNTESTPYFQMFSNGAFSEFSGLLGYAAPCLFFLPKVVILSFVTIYLLKILELIPTYITIFKRNRAYIIYLGNNNPKWYGRRKQQKEKEDLRAQTWGNVIVVAIGCGISVCFSLLFAWIISPVSSKEINKEQIEEIEYLKRVVVDVKTANLRIGPGTNYGYAHVNEDDSGGKWQVHRYDTLKVISEVNDWYIVQVDTNSRQVYIKQSLCRDLLEQSE